MSRRKEKTEEKEEDSAKFLSFQETGQATYVQRKLKGVRVTIVAVDKQFLVSVCSLTYPARNLHMPS